MNLGELVARFRADVRDNVAPFLFSAPDVTAWFNEAQAEAALRADLLKDDSTEAVCELAVTAGTASYQLHAAVNRVTWATFVPVASEDQADPCPTTLAIVNRIQMDARRPGWRTRTEPPRELIVEQRQARLGCKPDTDGTLTLEVFRGPLAALTEDSSTPEIAQQHHLSLVEWVKHRAYLRPDAETYDQAASERALEQFERVFGLRPDAQLRQDTEDLPHVNTSYF